MPELQEVFQRINERKHEQREIKRMYLDALESRHDYKNIVEQLDKLREQKKQIENEVRQELGNDWDKLDLIKLHQKQDNELMSDIALNKLLAGESIDLKDDLDQPYEPVFSVKFKKGNVVNQHPQ